MSISSEMVARVLSDYLETMLKDHDAGEAAGSFIASAANSLHRRDFDLFIAECRKVQKRMDKSSKGLPSQICRWHPHYLAKLTAPDKP